MDNCVSDGNDVINGEERVRRRRPMATRETARQDFEIQGDIATPASTVVNTPSLSVTPLQQQQPPTTPRLAPLPSNDEHTFVTPVAMTKVARRITLPGMTAESASPILHRGASSVEVGGATPLHDIPPPPTNAPSMIPMSGAGRAIAAIQARGSKRQRVSTYLTRDDDISINVAEEVDALIDDATSLLSYGLQRPQRRDNLQGNIDGNDAKKVPGEVVVYMQRVGGRVLDAMGILPLDVALSAINTVVNDFVATNVAVGRFSESARVAVGSFLDKINAVTLHELDMHVEHHRLEVVLHRAKRQMLWARNTLIQVQKERAKLRRTAVRESVRHSMAKEKYRCIDETRTNLISLKTICEAVIGRDSESNIMNIALSTLANIDAILAIEEPEQMAEAAMNWGK